MAVPAGDEAHPVPLQNFLLVDDVLEHLVEGMPHVQGAIGVGRPIVQGEAFAWVVASQLEIDAVLCPEGLKFRFPLRGIGTHTETCLQKIERVLVGRAGVTVLLLLLGHGGAAGTGIIRLRGGKLSIAFF